MGEQIHVLHLDNDPITLRLFSQYIDHNEPDIIYSSLISIKKALKKVSEEYVDCIILDHKIPEIDGIKIAEEIRSQLETPIILFTGDGCEEVAENAFKAGINYYLKKDIDPKNCLNLINVIKKEVINYKDLT
jgi:CheY-like chemotaxis protein